MQGRAGQSKTGQGWAGLTSTLGIAGHTSMHGRAGQGRAGQGRAGQGRAGQGTQSCRAGQGTLACSKAGQPQCWH